MIIKREHFEKHKNGLHLISIGKNKYIYIKGIKYVARKIFKTICAILNIPFSILCNVINGIVTLMVFDLPHYLKDDVWCEFKDIFPCILKVEDKD